MPTTTITIPPDVASRLKDVSRFTGLPPRQAAGMLLTLVLGRVESVHHELKITAPGTPEEVTYDRA